jgi:protein-S-isoprenylcysteine O-methyltransferase Ste14
VVKHGPYRYLRHPGYLGTPLLLDGRYSFLAVILLLAVTGIRTRKEDRTLQEELNGYDQYAREVPFKLIPGIW